MRARRLTVYHGTDRKFKQFKRSPRDIGIHFGTRRQAADRVKDLPRAVVLKVRITLKNPLVLLADLGDWGDVNMLQEYLGPANYEVFTEDEINRWKRTADVRRALISKGYDGIVYENRFEDEGSFYRNTGGGTSHTEGGYDLSFIVFSPDQIQFT